MSAANWAAEVPGSTRSATWSSPSMREHLGAVGDVVAAAGQLGAVLDGDAPASLPTSHDRVEVAGQPDERRVEAVEIVAQHLLGVAGRVGGHEDDVDLLAVGVVEPGHRRGEVGHHDLADVGAVRVAEEDQRQPACRCSSASEYGSPSVSVSGVAGTSYGSVEHGAGERARRLVAAAPGQHQHRGEQRGQRRSVAGS